MRRTVMAAGLLALVACALPPGAGAALRWSDCRQIEGCGAKVRVPLDRSGAIPGSVTIDVSRWQEFHGAATSAPVVLLAGGADTPGTAYTEGYGSALDGVLLQGQRRVQYTLSPRGTAKGDFLRCRSLKPDRTLDDPALVSACAAKLGPRRNLFGTRDLVADLEAARAAIGIDRFVLIAVGGGAPPAIQYAREHSERIESLVLLSPDPPDGPDPFSLPSLQSIPRVLGRVCSRGCASFTRDPAADLAELARRVASAPLSGYTLDYRGRRHPARLGPRELLGVFLAARADERMPADIPGAVVAALRGDSLPFLRLVRRAHLPSDDVDFLGGTTLHALQACGDGRFPWDDSAAPADRSSQARAAAAAIPDSAFGPLGREAALTTRQLTTCLAWPAPRPGPLPAGAPVDIPALAVFGEEDVRHPAENAGALKAVLPRLVVSTIAGVGEPLIQNAPTGCVDDVLGAFFGAKSVPGRCERYETVFDRPPHVDKPPPASLSELKPYGRYRGAVGRTLTALGLTLRDVFGEEQYAEGTHGDEDAPFFGPGLRAGRFVEFNHGERLHGVVFVPGVVVDGRLGVLRDGAFFRLSGRAAAPGTIRLSARGRVTGALGGRRIHTDIFHLLTFAERQARG